MRCASARCRVVVGRFAIPYSVVLRSRNSNFILFLILYIFNFDVMACDDGRGTTAGRDPPTPGPAALIQWPRPRSVTSQPVSTPDSQLRRKPRSTPSKTKREPLAA